MKCLMQRVKKASVTIENEIFSQIGHGLLLFIGVEKGDTIDNAEKLADKILKLRVFEDDNGKMNKSLVDISGEMLIVSQFTLCGDCRKGTRPSFDKSEEPSKAIKLYEDFITIMKKSGLNVQTGKFAAMMDVSLVNDGPVTFMIEK